MLASASGISAAEAGAVMVIRNVRESARSIIYPSVIRPRDATAWIARWPGQSAVTFGHPTSCSDLAPIKRNGSGQDEVYSDGK
jgi:hypothetical protein